MNRIRTSCDLSRFRRCTSDFPVGLIPLPNSLRRFAISFVLASPVRLAFSATTSAAVWLNGSTAPKPETEDSTASATPAPAFAAPFDEVETLLAAPDWATQLRNVLGLSHFAGSPAKPLPVVLCRYNLSRVERAARKAKVAVWAAIPTVLEAGNGNGPGSAFFPFPKAAASTSFGFGVTVDLSPAGGLDFKSELLHFRLDYTLDDFVAVGEITDEVTDAQLATCRQRHFDLLEREFQYRSDVP